MSRAHYEYVHQAGYGRDDHRADELIARAARILGLDGSHAYVAASVGLVSHAVPMGRAQVRLPAVRGARARMVSALRAARREIGHYVDTSIAVVCVRTRVVEGEDGRHYWTRPTRVTEHRHGHTWVTVDASEVQS